MVLDGASTDGTLDVVKRYADRIDYFTSEPDRGIYDALNKAIPLARGDLICVLNADDWLESHAAETAVRRLRDPQEPTLLLTGANARHRRHDGYEPDPVRKWYPALVHPGSYFACALACHNGVYATRSAYQVSGPYDPSLEIASDFKWLMTCLESGIDFIYTKEVTVNYVHGGMSSDHTKHSIECIRIVRERFPLLSAEDIGGLYHVFFLLSKSNDVLGKPENPADFLQKLFLRYSEDIVFLESFAWASTQSQYFHTERYVKSRISRPLSARELATGVLLRYPKLYRKVVRAHQKFSRR